MARHIKPGNISDFLRLLLVVFMSMALSLSQSPGQSVNEYDLAMTPETEAVLDKIHLEMFKQNLLKQLGLRDPPVVQWSRAARVPEVLAISGQDDGQTSTERVQAQQQHIIISQTEQFCRRTVSETCLQFNLGKELLSTYEAKVTKAELWFKVRPHLTNTTFLVKTTRIVRGTRKPNQVVAKLRLTEVPEGGWQSVDLQVPVQTWLDDGNEHPSVVVSCRPPLLNPCIVTSASSYPFLLLQIRNWDSGTSSRSTRTKRTTCTGNTCCMARPLTVTFSELGWHFIRSPLTLHSHYCFGKCTVPDVSNMNLANPREHTLMMQYLAHVKGRHDYSPCCSPTSLKNATLLYVNFEGQLIRSFVSILVNSCGCI